MKSKQRNNNFSAINRKDNLQTLASEVFDLLVIGGGVTGCGIALDAASRGMKVALVEKNDFASGTSSKSTKLIHGGLRYLKQLEFGLVRETGTERAIVHQLAPHLVLPEKMLLPIVKGGTYGKWTASLGVLVYDILAGVKGNDRRKMLSKTATLQKEPLLNPNTLKGSCYYAEYRTDDARLTIELIKKASSNDALALNYVKASEFIYTDGKVTGIKAVDELTQNEFNVQAKQVVSAAGPWVDLLRSVNQSKKGKSLHLTKGVHIVVPKQKLPLNNSTYFDVDDGRMVFAIPRGKVTYIGTTDTNYKGNLDRITVSKEDVQYLTNAVNNTFPSISLTENDIVSSWAGLRPLIHEDGKSPSELSRKDEIFISDTNLISIAGGKLTGYRKMAQRVVDLVNKNLDHAFSPCITKEIALTQDPLKNTKAVDEYLKKLEEQLASVGLEPYYAWYLVTNYGQQCDLILQKLKEFEEEISIALIRAELWYSIQYEMTNSLSDFYIRRTGRLFFDIKSIHQTIQVIQQDMQTYLQWDDQRLKEELATLESHIYDATNFYRTSVNTLIG